eukprot:Em0019g739a
MAKELIEQLQQSFKCPICSCRLRDPKVLPCLHSLCLHPCLKGLSTGEDGRLECPVCRERHNVPKDGVAKFQTNFTLQNLAELLEVCEEKPNKLLCGNGLDENPAIGRCLQCEVYLCDSCLKLHKKQVATRAHTTVLLEQIKAEGEKTLHHPQNCSLHEKEEIKLYCKKCSRAICRDCTLVEHRDHEFAFVKDIAPEMEKRIINAHSELSKKEAEFQAHISHIDKVLKDTTAQEASNAEKIKTIFAGYVKELEAQRDKLLLALKEQVSSKEKQVSAEKGNVSLELIKLTSSVQFCQQLLKSGSDVQKAQMEFQVTERLNNLKDTKWDKSTVFLTEWWPEGDSLDAFSYSQMITSSTCVKASSFTVEGSSAHCGILGHCQFVIKLKEETKIPCPPYAEFNVSVQLTAKVGDEGEEGMVTIPHTIRRAGPSRWVVSYFLKVRGRCDISATLRSEHVSGSPFSVEVQKLSVGTCVQRGASWKWGDQDGNGMGIVVDLDQMRKWVTVRWDTGHTNGYRWGADGSYDLQPVENRK